MAATYGRNSKSLYLLLIHFLRTRQPKRRPTDTARVTAGSYVAGATASSYTAGATANSYTAGATTNSYTAGATANSYTAGATASSYTARATTRQTIFNHQTSQ